MMAIHTLIVRLHLKCIDKPDCLDRRASAGVSGQSAMRAGPVAGSQHPTGCQNDQSTAGKLWPMKCWCDPQAPATSVVAWFANLPMVPLSHGGGLMGMFHERRNTKVASFQKIDHHRGTQNEHHP
jgi:hypothetical protein